MSGEGERPAELDRLGHGGLRRVAHGQIVYADGVLSHRSDVLPPDVLAILNSLAHHGFVTPAAPAAECPQWQVAELTVPGMQLLGWWNNHRAPDTAAQPTPTDCAPTGSGTAVPGRAV